MQFPVSYLAIFILVAVLGYLAERNPKACITRNNGIVIRPDPGAAIILSLALILMSAFRYRVGTDFNTYYRNRVVEFQPIIDSLVHFKEPGIKVLSFLAHSIYDNGQSLIIISAILTVGLYCWTIYKYHATYLISMLLYILLGEWQGSFNGIRQYLAAAIVFAGHRYIFRRDFIKYCIVVLIASLFHISAVIMIIPYFLLARKPDITQLIILSVGAALLSFSYETIFSLIEKVKGSVLNTSDPYITGSVKLPRILVAFVPVFVYVLMGKKTGHTLEQDFYINSLFFHAFTMLAGIGSRYLSRIGIYTGASVVIGYGFLFQIVEDERSRKALIFVSLGLFFVYWIYSLQNGNLIPFRWFFDS